jgi:hypothetical protein
MVVVVRRSRAAIVGVGATLLAGCMIETEGRAGPDGAAADRTADADGSLEADARDAEARDAREDRGEAREEGAAGDERSDDADARDDRADADDAGEAEAACVPATEVCNGRDDDCNGTVDDGTGFECTAGASEACDDSPCGAGTRSCDPATCRWGACVPTVVPECTPGATEDCWEVPCGRGRRVCASSCEWSLCSSCPDGETCCWDGCKNTHSDVVNCGACGNICWFEPCRDGVCGW